VFDPVSSLWPFNLTAGLVVISPGDDCDLQGRDLTGKIVLIGNFTCDENYLRVPAIEAAGAIGIIKSLYLQHQYEWDSAFITGNTVGQNNLAFVGVDYRDGIILEEIWRARNCSLQVTILSDEHPLLHTGQTAGSLFLLIFGLILAVVALAFVSYQLHSFKGGAVMTRIALLLLLVSNLALITERILRLVFVFTGHVQFFIITSILTFGIMFVGFAAVFIGLYWSTLVFTVHAGRMQSKRVFLPILIVFLVLFVAYITFLMIDELFWISRSVFEIIFIVVLGLVSLYFIAIGAFLIHSLQKYGKAAVRKRKISKRLTTLLILSGISQLALLSTTLVTAHPVYITRIDYFWGIPSLMNFFCACSIVTLAALFKKPTTPKPSGK
jgi:hypothetical protein